MVTHSTSCKHISRKETTFDCHSYKFTDEDDFVIERMENAYNFCPKIMFTWNIDPVLFSIGSLEIRYYGVFFASGLMLAYLLARKMCRIKNLSVENLDDLSVYLIIGLIVGARFGHIIFMNLIIILRTHSKF